MSTDQDHSQDQDGDSDLVKQLRGLLRDKSSRASELEAELGATRKQTSFQQLGIDPTKGVGKLFYESYNGELTAEAVKAAAESYDLTFGEPQEQAPAPANDTAADAVAHAAMNGASAGASAPALSKSDPTKVAWAAHDQTMAETGSRDNAMASHFAAKLGEALKQRNG